MWRAFSRISLHFDDWAHDAFFGFATGAAGSSGRALDGDDWMRLDIACRPICTLVGMMPGDGAWQANFGFLLDQLRRFHKLPAPPALSVLSTGRGATRLMLSRAMDIAAPRQLLASTDLLVTDFLRYFRFLEEPISERNF